MHDPLLGTIIGERYQLTHIVGQGGMGIVYRAEDVRLSGRPCAVKLLTGRSADPEEIIRFERELQIISRLHSQHVVSVLDAGSLVDGRRYIVMELLEGLPLSAMLKRTGPLAPHRAIHLVKGVLAGLSEAHEHGVVHRDLKPANVFVTRSRTGDEVAKVLDFGIAKDTSRGAEADLTAASMLIGTPKYMAPEQFLKRPADQRTDLYAVGLLFYQMLAGQPPFSAEMPVPDALLTMPAEFRIGWLHVNQAPVYLELPHGVWDVVSKMLAKEPDDRYDHAHQIIEELVMLAHSGRVMEPLPGVMSGEMEVHREDRSGTTGFPVAGESLNAPAPRRSKAGLMAVASIIVAAGVGGAVWYGVTRNKAPVAGARQEGVCYDELHSDPPDAVVRQGAKALGMTPLKLERPCTEVWRLEVERKGFETEVLTLRSRSSETLSFKLKKERAAEPDRPAPSMNPTTPASAPPSAAVAPASAPATDAAAGTPPTKAVAGRTPARAPASKAPTPRNVGKASAKRTTPKARPEPEPKAEPKPPEPKAEPKPPEPKVDPKPKGEDPFF
jgi:hypothetical protein